MKKLTILLFSILIMAPFMANAISLDSFDSQVKNNSEQLTTLQFEEHKSSLRNFRNSVVIVFARYFSHSNGFRRICT